ncbi:MAG: EAL domain-containing protein [Rhizobiaceae bacterium]
MTLRRNSLHWPGIARALLFLGSVGMFLAGGYLATDYLLDSQREKQLNELGGLALRSSEAVIDYGVSALGEFSDHENHSCMSGPMQKMRLFVYRSNFIKDLRVVRPDASVVCSAFSETLEFDRGWVGRDEMLESEAGNFRLFQVNQFMGTALGVMVDLDHEHSVIGILGVDASLLDVLPDELRGHGSVSLSLTDGKQISSAGGAVDPREDLLRFVVASDKYPIETLVSVHADAFHAWNREPIAPIMLLAGLLGAVFGALLSRNLFRPRSLLDRFDFALSQGRIRPYFQPIFDLGTGKVVGAEILARWIRTDGSVLPPGRFIELAEQNGRIPEMTWSLLSTALDEMKPLLRVEPDFRLSINIAPSHFVSAGFRGKLRDLVKKADVPPHQITLEITERENFEDPDLATICVANLRGHGFNVAIDDVGIGHSGLSQIQRLRADTMKIDKFFVDSVTLDSTASSMIAMLVRLAKEMDMDVVAEGIEEKAQVDALLECGITKGQGYIVSPPIAAAPFLELFAARAASGKLRVAATRAA